MIIVVVDGDGPCVCFFFLDSVVDVAFFGELLVVVAVVGVVESGAFLAESVGAA